MKKTKIMTIITKIKILEWWKKTYN